MIHILKKIVPIVVFTIVLTACGGGGGDDEPEVPEVKAPEAAILKSPLKNEECNQGNIISDTESDVVFKWNAANNTTGYKVVLKNLNSNKTVETSTTGTQLTLTLLRGVAYSWNVVSVATGTTKTATSETWKLFNAGLPVENYAPFPAEVVSPPMGGLTNSTVTLEWNGSDADNDIESYDVYLSTDNPPTTLYQNTTTSKIENITLNSDEIYFWKVVTKDSHGNNSESQIFDFRTQ
ncbi:hypothetical protein SAMN05444411_104146 [Lutibacter oricola]|uniref:Fibronectin type-III domain-containing protein n=1 Tax=Lutibacter oricola TaxID=762486 RepID=A0A1H3AJG8_9FLAO|nr:hypothetical protein [Lutibacter oricola]SDX29860.1 hypothetical protein SAMN05444411_104146 [Lutibacter oricola]